MPVYTWSGINQGGKKINGIDRAYNQEQLKANLAQQNIFPLKITYNLFRTFAYHYKIKTKHIIHLTEQLSILINANIPIIKALTIISEDEQNSKLKEIIISCKNSISTGKSLSQALEQYPQCFSKLFCSLINVGEQAGALDIMLVELSNYFKKNETQKNKIIKALLYPIVVLSTTLIIIIIFLVFIIPQFASMFNNFGAKLPSYTQSIISLSNLIQINWQIILGLIITTTFSVKVIHYHSLKFREFMDKLYLNIPLLKNILIYSIMARLTKTLSLTLKSGMPLITALNITATTISSLPYQLALKNATKSIVNGKSFTNALSEQNLFPTKVIQMINLGEEGGSLETMLEKIAINYNEALNNLTDNLNNLLEPIMMLILGVIVGSLVIGMYLPLFRMGMII